MKSKLEIAVAALPRYDFTCLTDSLCSLPADREESADGEYIKRAEALAAIQAQPDAAVGGWPVGLDYEADDGTVAAYRAGELVWHAHIYPNGEDVDDVQIANQIAAMLNAKSVPVQAQGSDAA